MASQWYQVSRAHWEGARSVRACGLIGGLGGGGVRGADDTAATSVCAGHGDPRTELIDMCVWLACVAVFFYFYAKVVYFEENHSTVVLRPRLRCGVCVIISILGAIEIYS